jgi:biotin synthase
MDSTLYNQLINADTTPLPRDICHDILDPEKIDLFELVNAAYVLRKRYCGKTVEVQILNNAANGNCSEDCNYCPQSKNSHAAIENYSMKPEEEIIAEAERAYKAGAHRYCMAFSGRGPSIARTKKIADIVRKIKERYPIETCVSAGLMDDEHAALLREAGCDRINHNLNTSERNYEKICTTHSWRDRVNTIHAARNAGMEVCSGLIVGMGESTDELIDIAYKLAEVGAKSIPVNFLLPIEGNPLYQAEGLTPDYCLRVLCLFRFLIPRTEIRAAAGREYHLRGLEVLSLYVANSLFLDGYLNATGTSRTKTLQMIKDAGFEINSDFSIDEILAHESPASPSTPNSAQNDPSVLKVIEELRPTTTEVP